jgi:hypothetical protein
VREPGDPPRLSDDLAAFVHRGVAATVATRDEDLKPAVTRAWGPQLADDGATLTLCIIAPPGSATRANLERKGPIAIGFSPPTIARAVQLKGRVLETREPGADELERAGRHLDAFCAEAEAIGFTRGLAPRLYDAPALLAVTASIEQVFDQTPGPAAGRRL